jgi:hypothetical protein
MADPHNNQKIKDASNVFSPRLSRGNTNLDLNSSLQNYKRINCFPFQVISYSSFGN